MLILNSSDIIFNYFILQNSSKTAASYLFVHYKSIEDPFSNAQVTLLHMLTPFNMIFVTLLPIYCKPCPFLYL